MRILKLALVFVCGVWFGWFCTGIFMFNPVYPPTIAIPSSIIPETDSKTVTGNIASLDEKTGTVKTGAATEVTLSNSNSKVMTTETAIIFPDKASLEFSLAIVILFLGLLLALFLACQ